MNALKDTDREIAHCRFSISAILAVLAILAISLLNPRFSAQIRGKFMLFLICVISANQWSVRGFAD